MSSTIASALLCLVALIQAAIALVEMFLWRLPQVHSRLDYAAVEAEKVAPIVQNAGLYNGFLAAGLIWAVVSRTHRSALAHFFLLCVATAGVFGAVTLKPTTLLLQTLPALVALGAIWMGRGEASARVGADLRTSRSG
jgi:putative membrane protein